MAGGTVINSRILSDGQKLAQRLKSFFPAYSRTEFQSLQPCCDLLVPFPYPNALIAIVL